MERKVFEALAGTEGQHWWFRGRRAILASLIEQRVKPSAGARILEAGCGTGGNLDMLRRYGQVDAFEYDDYARAIARKRSGIDVTFGRLPDGIDHLQGPYDAIALFDVLEHVEQDEAALCSLAALLAPAGKLVLTVPALQFLWSDHDRDHHHFRRYSANRLRKVIESAGLRIEFISYFNSILLPVAIAQRLGGRLLGISPNSDAIPPPLLNRSLAKVFASERHILKHIGLPLGLSICAVVSRG